MSNARHINSLTELLAAIEDQSLLLAPSTDFYYTCGWKYQVHQHVFHPLKFVTRIDHSFDGRYYALFKHDGIWWIWVKIGCCYDGPTWFPDFRWAMYAALIHDVLHWLIARGIVDEKDNKAMDKELRECILNGNEPISILQGGNIMRKPYAAIMYRGVRTVYQSVGTYKQIHHVAV